VLLLTTTVSLSALKVTLLRKYGTPLWGPIPLFKEVIMCEILIRAKEHSLVLAKEADLTERQIEARKVIPRKGSPIVVRGDGHTWGKKEGPPNHVIVKIPGLDPGKVQDLLIEDDANDGEGKQILYNIRKYKITGTLMNSMIASGGIITISENNLRQGIKQWQI